MECTDYHNSLSLHMIYTGYYKAGKEWSYKKVLSPFTRIYLIDKGTANLFMNKQKYIMKEGDMVIVPKFTFHEYECNEFINHYYICFFDHFINRSNIFECFNIEYQTKASSFDKYLMKRFLELNPGRQIIDPDPKSYDNKPEIFNKINIDNNKLINEIESNGILLQLFSRFLIHNNAANRINENKYKRMSNVFSYINNNLGNKILIKDLSDIMCVSPDYFIRIFKNINGITPNQYIQKKRIERAQTLMTSSFLSIKEIAEEIGIPNLSQFSKAFHKSTGLTPTEYTRNKYYL